MVYRSFSDSDGFPVYTFYPILVTPGLSWSPQMKEAHRLHGFGKEIGIVVNGGNKWYNNASLLNQFAHKIMTPVNMFGTRVVFGVIG